MVRPDKAPSRWTSVHLAALMSIMMVAVAGCDTSPSPEASGELVSDPGIESSRTTFIPVDGRLVFTRSVDLTFDVTGDVAEVLVKEGDRVLEGQVLASLDSTTLADLEGAVAQARFDLDKARDQLEIAREDFTTTPIFGARFEQGIAKAKQRLDEAQEQEEDFERDYIEDLARAGVAKADAEVRLDNAREDLEDFLSDYDEALAGAVRAKARADTEVDDGRVELEDFEFDESRDLIAAREKLTDSLETFELAEDRLTEFLRTPGKFIDPSDDALGGSSGDLVDQLRPERGLGDLRRFEADEDLARANLKQAYDDFQEELQRGNDPLRLGELEAAVKAAEAKQALAEVDLERELEGADELELQRRQVAVEESEAKLAQAEQDLAEELEGVDQFELEVRQKDVARRLAAWIDFLDGPEPFLVNAKEADVKKAQENLSEAQEDLEGATIRAPFDGIVSQINVEVDDEVNNETRAIELIDPSRVEVDGVVDAVDINRLEVGSKARIAIASLRGEEFEGIVTVIGETPRTERGSLNFPVKIRVQIPQGVEVPTRLTVVKTVILTQ